MFWRPRIAQSALPRALKRGHAARPIFQHAHPFSREMADVASSAFLRFGRASGHPAKLNFGDCMAYAVSVVTRAPLLLALT
jgi:uncharacterized protein with PIN domain